MQASVLLRDTWRNPARLARCATQAAWAPGALCSSVMGTKAGIRARIGPRCDQRPPNPALRCDAATALGLGCEFAQVDEDARITEMRRGGRTERSNAQPHLIENLEPPDSKDPADRAMAGITEGQRAAPVGRAKRENAARMFLSSDALGDRASRALRECRASVRESGSDDVSILALGLRRDDDEELMQAITEEVVSCHYLRAPPERR